MTDHGICGESQTQTTQDSHPLASSFEITERSAELFRMALPVISKHGRGFAPISYALWYEYVRGENLQLRHALKNIISTNGRITAHATVELYQQHIVAQIENDLGNGQSDLLHLVDQVDNSIDASSQSVAGLDSHLEDFVDTFSDSVGTEAGQQQLSALKADVLSVNAKMRDLQEDLERVRHSVRYLAEELAQTRHRAKHDPLTGLLNRRGFDASLAEQIEQATLASDPADQNLTMMLIDIDHFKRVNDEHGHLTGDNVIRGVAHLLNEAVMRKDYLSRYGGEEFAVVMPATDESGGLVAAQRICESVSNAVFRRVTKAGTQVRVTISVGLAQFVAGESASDLIQRADQALYRAKHAGRNQVCATA